MNDLKFTTVRDLMAKSEKNGYTQALVDLMTECRIKASAGFIMSDDLLTEIIEKLLDQNIKNKKTESSAEQTQEESIVFDEEGGECMRCGEWCGFKLVGDERVLYCPNCN